MTTARGLEDLTDRTIDPGTTDAAETALLRGWVQAVARGFHEPRLDDEQLDLWLRCAREDGAAAHGWWESTPAFGSGALPVATFTAFDGTLHTGAGRLPLRMVTDVTVAPTHRRRGLLRTMLVGDLAATAARGLPLAALTVSEGSIYGRFGFGPATRKRRLSVDVTGRFGLHAPPVPGRVVLAEPGDAGDVTTDVARRHHAQTRGTVSRPAVYREVLLGNLDWSTRGKDHLLRVAVHLDADGRPDGYVGWRPRGEQDGRATVEVADLLALGPGAHLALWRFLADLDLVERVRWHHAPVVDPLDHAVVDPRIVQTTGTSDLLWLRVLDVAAALEGRPWGADGEVVLEVADALGHAAGRHRVVVREGRAEVTRVDDEPDLRLDVAVLGTLLLGDVDVATLAGAGRLEGSDAALTTYAAMADLATPPWCPTGF